MISSTPPGTTSRTVSPRIGVLSGCTTAATTHRCVAQENGIHAIPATARPSCSTWTASSTYGDSSSACLNVDTLHPQQTPGTSTAWTPISVHAPSPTATACNYENFCRFYVSCNLNAGCGGRSCASVLKLVKGKVAIRARGRQVGDCWQFHKVRRALCHCSVCSVTQQTIQDNLDHFMPDNTRHSCVQQYRVQHTILIYSCENE